MRLHTSQFGSFGNRVNKLCFPSAMLDVGFPAGCTERRTAGGIFSTSAGETSVELDEPFVNPSGCSPE